jgi:hypothetical protein
MKKNVIRLTESELKNYIRKVIKEQAQAQVKTPDLESIKSQVVGKKIQLTNNSNKIMNTLYDDYFTSKKGEVLTTFLVDSVELTPNKTSVVLTGRDLSFTDKRSNETHTMNMSQFKVQTLTWQGCSYPHSFQANGLQGTIVNSQVKTETPPKAYLFVTNKTLSDILFNASGCAADIDSTPDFRP